MKITAAISTALAITLVGNSAPAQTTYRVKRIADGDTITVTAANGGNIKVRFACIDTSS